jgi:hypothetical protein
MCARRIVMPSPASRASSPAVASGVSPVTSTVMFQAGWSCSKPNAMAAQIAGV